MLQIFLVKTENIPLPTNIFYYRDGVSEGEYDNVLATEARAIQGKVLFDNNSVGDY